MSMWPDTLKIGPLREWPGAQTPASMQVNSSFRAPLSKTLDLLDKEMWHLAKTQAELESAELLVAISANQFRRDGRPYATAKAEHPGVVFSMDSPHGHLSYPSDRFVTWEENLRAIALSLESLRKVNRYGVTRNGEQYRGFQAIEGTAGGGVNAAFIFLADVIERGIDQTDRVEVAKAVRMAKRRTHPDSGSDSRWAGVLAAEATLRKAGLL